MGVSEFLMKMMKIDSICARPSSFPGRAFALLGVIAASLAGVVTTSVTLHSAIVADRIICVFATCHGIICNHKTALTIATLFFTSLIECEVVKKSWKSFQVQN